MTQDGSNRAATRIRFLEKAGWADATAVALAGDASTRSYERLARGGETALLMNAPPGAETAAGPASATPDERRALGYNALARLAGPNLAAFLAVAEALRSAGLSAPQIYTADAREGFALIEDFGDGLFARVIAEGVPEEPLYAAAVDTLLALHSAKPAPPVSDQYTMLTYDRIALNAEIALLPEWYWPHKTGADPASSLEAEYFAAWAPALEQLSPPSTIVLRDFHAENLLWMPDREGPARVGVIDFQDALIGHAAYDLASLLEDARRDVSPALAAAMLARYCDRSGADFDKEAFCRDYAILAAQRNAKILGIFARLIHRDRKPRYEAFLPRVEGHFRKDLEHEALAPVRQFLENRLPEIAP